MGVGVTDDDGEALELVDTALGDAVDALAPADGDPDAVPTGVGVPGPADG